MIEENQTQPPGPPSRRGQAILRIVLYLLGVGVILVLASLVASPFIFRVMPPAGIRIGSQVPLSVLAILYLPFAIGVVVFTRYFVVLADKRPFETFGLARESGWVRELLLGLALGIGLPALIFAVSYLAGWTKITGSLFTQSPSRIILVLVQTLTALIGVAVTEEMIVRGYILQTLKWGYGTATALIASSLLFGLVHLFNPGASFLAFLGTAGAGLFLGYCYLVTKRLWLPIGWHFGWNFTLGPIFGFPVSGIDIPAWVAQKTSGPTLWTGGRFGPEASLMMVIILLLGTLAVKLIIRPSDHSTI